MTSKQHKGKGSDPERARIPDAEAEQAATHSHVHEKRLRFHSWLLGGGIIIGAAVLWLYLLMVTAPYLLPISDLFGPLEVLFGGFYVLGGAAVVGVGVWLGYRWAFYAVLIAGALMIAGNIAWHMLDGWRSLLDPDLVPAYIAVLPTCQALLLVRASRALGSNGLARRKTQARVFLRRPIAILASSWVRASGGAGGDNWAAAAASRLLE